MPARDLPPRRRRESLRPTPQAREHAAQLRRAMSDAEVLLWLTLRADALGFSFRRQKPMGPYVADFYCHQALLVVEVDGIGHESKGQHDAARNAWMRDRGLEVLRIPAQAVYRDRHHVAMTIQAHCKARVAHLDAIKQEASQRKHEKQ